MRVAVLLSGGVDSSVALGLLQEAGHEVEAFYLKVWLEAELAGLGDCPWEEDLRYARAVCDASGVALEVVPMQRRYHDEVVADAIAELAAGGTPSPDVLCNRQVKFGAFFEHLASRPGRPFDRVASGHYARIDDGAGGPRLLRAVDPVKDQTYFLHRLSRAQLSRCLFPIGGLRKVEVRRRAGELGLPTGSRPDSQGICFLGRIRFRDFVRAHLGERPGEIREATSGRTLGRHPGVWFFTVGQRHGLGLPGGPWYVVGKEVETAVVWVAHAGELASSRRDSFTVPAPSWIGEAPAAGRLEVRVRHAPALAGCRIEPEPGSGAGIRAVLDRPDAGIATGQSAVFYASEVCLGGGRIVAEPGREISSALSAGGGTASGR